MDCDHLLGYLHSYEGPEWINASDKAELLKSKARCANRVNAVTGGPTDIKPSHYTDRRRNMATWFPYCPNCGQKLRP